MLAFYTALHSIVNLPPAHPFTRGSGSFPSLILSFSIPLPNVVGPPVCLNLPPPPSAPCGPSAGLTPHRPLFDANNLTAPGPRASDIGAHARPLPGKLFVGNLPQDVTQEELRGAGPCLRARNTLLCIRTYPSVTPPRASKSSPSQRVRASDYVVLRCCELPREARLQGTSFASPLGGGAGTWGPVKEIPKVWLSS